MREAFRTRDELLARLAKLELPPPAPWRPNNLPCATLGTLVKDREEFLLVSADTPTNLRSS